MPWDRDHEWVGDPLTLDGMRLVGAALKRRRVKLGLSQTSLERMTGVDQTTISRLERGRPGGLRWSRFALVVAVLGGLDFGDLADVGVYGRRRVADPFLVARAAWARGLAADATHDVDDGFDDDLDASLEAAEP